MPAVPFIVQGGLAAGSAIAGHFASKAAAAGAMQRSPEEQGALDRITALAGPAAQYGQQLSGMAIPNIGRAFDYYGRLVGGDRAALRGAVAPEMADINDAYKGANAAITRGYLQGGERNQALAENARAGAGKIASLVSGVRPMAAEALSRLGPSVASVGQQGQYLAGILNQGVLQQGFQNRLLGQQAGQAAAANWGNLFARLSSALSSTTKKGSTAGSDTGDGGYTPAGTGTFGRPMLPPGGIKFPPYALPWLPSTQVGPGYNTGVIG
jgi:hypothetical protein